MKAVRGLAGFLVVALIVLATIAGMQNAATRSLVLSKPLVTSCRTT